MKKVFSLICAFLPAFIVLTTAISCGRQSPLENKMGRAILSLGDERRTGDLMDLARNAGEEEQIWIARSFASIRDSLSIPLLKLWLLEGKSPELRRVSAFACGQFRSAGNLALLEQAYKKEAESKVKGEIILAIGKSGGGEWLVKNRVDPSHDLSGAFALAMTYTHVSEDAPGWLVELARKGRDAAKFHALYVLGRYSGNLQAYQEELSQIAMQKLSTGEVGQLTRCLARLGRTGYPAIHNLYAVNSASDARIQLLNGLKMADDSLKKSLIVKGLQDGSVLVRESALNLLNQAGDLLTGEELLLSIRREQNAMIHYGLTALYMKQADRDEARRLSEEIIQKIKSNDDPYIIGYQCLVLASDFRNLAFLEKLMWETPDILVREFAFDAILKIRSDSRFPEFAREWDAERNGGIALDAHLAGIIQKACETGDVSLLAMAAVFLRDTSLPKAATREIPIEFSSVSFLEEALLRLKLPRDIETYGEVLKTLGLYRGKKIMGNLKPEYNNPPDWDLALRIPENQKIVFETDSGNIEVELWPDKAPATCAWFLKLIREEFFNEKRVHRVVPGFVIQSGCPRGDGFGSLMQTIRTEIHEDAVFNQGTLGMANAGEDTESCQWFITQAETPHLNGRYTAFGKVVGGMENVFRLNRGAIIRKVSIRN